MMIFAVAEEGRKGEPMDLIERQAAIDAIHCDITVKGKQNAELVASTIGAFVDRIKELTPAQPEPKWIPCSEKLPEKNCRCLTTNEAVGFFKVDWNVWIDGKWLYPHEKPIAWMPMPEPYQEGGAGRRTDGD